MWKMAKATVRVSKRRMDGATVRTTTIFFYYFMWRATHVSSRNHYYIVIQLVGVGIIVVYILPCPPSSLSYGCNPFSTSDSLSFFLVLLRHLHFWKWLLYFYMNMHIAYIHHTSYIIHYTCIDLFCNSAECLSIIQYSFTWHSLVRSFDKIFKCVDGVRVLLRRRSWLYFIFFIGPFVIYICIYYYAYLKKKNSLSLCHRYVYEHTHTLYILVRAPKIWVLALIILSLWIFHYTLISLLLLLGDNVVAATNTLHKYLILLLLLLLLLMWAWTSSVCAQHCPLLVPFFLVIVHVQISV